MTLLNVGVGQRYTTIKAAVAAARDGDTVNVQAGTYTNDFAQVRTKITLQAVGGQVTLVATVSPPNGKAILDCYTDTVVNGFSFFGSSVKDLNGAGIRSNAGSLTVQNCLFMNNQEGILTNADPNAVITIRNSEFANNGAGDGYSHNLYVGQAKQLVVENSYFHDSVIGHEIKSRALSTTIVGNRIFDNGGTTSYSIDVPNGGVVDIRNNVIEKGAQAENLTIIHFGGESAPYDGSKINISGNTIVNDRSSVIGMVNAAQAPVTFTGNSLFNVDPASFAGATTAGNTVLTARPALDISTMQPAIIPVTTRAPVITPGETATAVTQAVPEGAQYTTFGRDGAVLASGKILQVGANKAFTTLQQAVAASHDGDTIRVDAGTYTNDFAVITHKVTIEGVGGMARFVATKIPENNRGILHVSADITVRNLEFTGTRSYDGKGAGLFLAAGHATVVNCYFHGNDTSVYAATNPAGSVSIFDTEIASNGNADKATPNMVIGEIGSFTLQNSYVHDAVVSHEVTDGAYFSRIQNNRIIDGATSGASFDVNLGHGGDAVISGNTIEKGANAANGVLVHVGGEGATYTNTNVVISNNTLVSDLDNQWHPYTYFVFNDSSTAGVAAPLTVTGNTFVGGISGSEQVRGGTSLNATVSTSATLDTSAPWKAPAAQASAVTAGPDTLSLHIVGQTYLAPPQFVVTVDGVAAGGGVADGDQTFTFTGDWGGGRHMIQVTEINATYGQTLQGGRATVLSTTLNGVTVASSADINWGNYTVGITAPGAAKIATTAITQAQAGALFNATYYLNQNPDVKASGVDPFQHYMSVGWTQGRDPSVNFSTAKYLAAHPDVAAKGTNPLAQYVLAGKPAGEMAPAATPHSSYSAGIDAAWYYAQHPDVAASGQDAWKEYDTEGWKLGYNPDAYFDTNFYLTHNPDVAAAGMNPLTHYTLFGWKEGRDPSTTFSDQAYLDANPDVEAAQVNPLVHYLDYGRDEGRALFLKPEPAPAKVIRTEQEMFDANFYLAKNPDVAAAHVDPLYHYRAFGWTEGRDPSTQFSTNKYFAAYTDVKAAHIDPLAHYANYGQAEGRSAFPI